MKRRIVPGGILALSFAVVLLATSASTASADTKLYFWCAPLPTTPLVDPGCIEAGRREVFDFGDRKVGTTSPAQGFELGATVNATFNPRISVSGDYTQTNSCPPTLSGPFGMGGSCLITVTFTPTGTGPKRGTLRTGPGGPTVALTGKGVSTPTPPVLPLTLDVDVRDPQQLRRTGVVNINYARMEIGHCHVLGCPDYDARLVLGGDVKRTTKRFKVGGEADLARSRTIKARLKHLKQLRKEPTAPKIKIKFTATDEFGQRATEERKVELCSQIRGHREDLICRWHPSQK